MSSKPIKTLYCTANSYIEFSPTNSGEKRYQILAAILTQELNVNKTTGAPGQDFYTADDVVVGDWFVDLQTGRSLRIDELFSDISGNKLLTLTDVKGYEVNNSDSNDTAFTNGNISGAIFSISSITNQPLINFFSLRNNTVSNMYFGQAVQSKFQYITPISLSKSTHNIFTGKEVFTGPSYSQHNLGIFSVPATMSGDFHILVDAVYIPTSITSPNLFKLSIREMGTSNYIIQDKTFTSSDLNSLLKEASKTLDSNKKYEFFLTDFAIGLVFNLSIYFVQT